MVANDVISVLSDTSESEPYASQPDEEDHDLESFESEGMDMDQELSEDDISTEAPDSDDFLQEFEIEMDDAESQADIVTAASPSPSDSEATICY